MKQKITVLLLALALTLGLLAGCGGKSDRSSESSGSNVGSESSVGSADNESDSKIHATVILVLEDESEVEYELNVSADQTIREALYEAELISEDTLYAMFVDDIDGHVADVMNDGVTWLPCDMDGEQIPVTGEAISAFDSYVLEDNDSIKLVYTVVPNFED